MNYCKLFLLLFCVHFSLFAQDSKRVLFPFNFDDSWGFIDSRGEIIVQPIYEEANNFHDGFAKVRLDGYYGYIDATGKLAIENQFEVAGQFYNGIAIVYINRRPYYINTKGSFPFAHHFKKISPFSADGYAVVMNENNEKFVIDKKGEIIKKEANIISEKKPKEKVRKYLNEYNDLKEKYESKFEHLDYDLIKEYGDYLVYSEDDKYGVANLKKGFITNIWFDGINIETLTDELIQLKNNDGICYINQQGERIHIDLKELEAKRFLERYDSSIEKILRQFNISYMRMGHYEVGSIGNMPILRSAGGWSPSKNVFKKVTSIYNFKPNTLDLVVDDERNEFFDEKYEGFKFYISNKTKDSIYFEAYDSTLDLVSQAKDVDGQWKDIEFSFETMKSGFVNGQLYLMDKHAFHQLYLLPNTYWELIVPKYHGALKTKLRLKLTYKTQSDGKEVIVYSNEFDGSVNPAQFWYHKPYDATMKPDLGD